MSVLDMSEMEARVLANTENHMDTRQLYISALWKTPSGPERQLLKTVAYPYIYGYQGSIRNLLKP